MRVFTRTTKVLGVTPNELNDLAKLVAEAKAKGKAEAQTGPSTFLAIEVDENFRYVSSAEREHLRREAR